MDSLRRPLLTARRFWSFLARRDTSGLVPDGIPLREIRRPAPDKARLLSSGDSDHNRGWIKGVRLCAWGLSAVLCVNIILTTVAAILAYARNNAHEFISAPVYQGKCSLSKHWATGLQFLINILSTAMLAASNYCMQCLVAPSRKDIDNAHREKIWINIGIPDITGLLFIVKGRRKWLGIMLLLSSLPIHLIYNSATYYALGPSVYGVAMVQANQTPGINRAPSRDLDDQICWHMKFGIDIPNVGSPGWDNNLKKLSKRECLNTLAQDYVYGHKVVLPVTSTPLPNDQHLLYVGKGGFSEDPYFTGFDWMCGPQTTCSKKDLERDFETWSVSGSSWSLPVLNLIIPDQNYSTENVSVDRLGWYNLPDYRRLYNILQDRRPGEEEMRTYLQNTTLWDNSSWAKNIEIVGGQTQVCGIQDHYSKSYFAVESCLSLPAEEKCRLMFSPPICLIVILCNTIKIVCMFMASRDDRDDPLLIVGDAISSFLARPDSSTKDDALLSMAHVKRGTLGWHMATTEGCSCALCELRQQNDMNDTSRIAGRKRWMQAPGGMMWLCVLLMSASLISVAGYLLSLEIMDIYNYDNSSSIWDYRLGELNVVTLIGGISLPERGIIWNVLLANTPQLLVSLAYFMYNALLSCMLLAAEYDDYALQRKPLRVSWPKGSQRSTYYLSLPYRYSIPLLGASAVLHWLVSQSLYFVEIIPYDIHGDLYGAKIITCGYSPQATILAMILGVVLIGGSIALGMRRFKSSMPLALYCSAAISAACHPCTEGDHGMKPVQWGEVVSDSASSSSRPSLCSDTGDHGESSSDSRPQSRVTSTGTLQYRGRTALRDDTGLDASNHGISRVSGIDRFKGHSFYTSRWDYEYTGGDCNGNMEKLTDKRVAIIIVSGGHQDEDQVGDGWTDILVNLSVSGQKVAASQKAADPIKAAKELQDNMQMADYRKMEQVRAPGSTPQSTIPPLRNL